MQKFICTVPYFFLLYIIRTLGTPPSINSGPARTTPAKLLDFTPLHDYRTAQTAQGSNPPYKPTQPKLSKLN